jgi:hypothetical protein
MQMSEGSETEKKVRALKEGKGEMWEKIKIRNESVTSR